MRIAIVCFAGFDVINFEINLIFLIKPFFQMRKNQDENFENEKSFRNSQKQYH